MYEKYDLFLESIRGMYVGFTHILMNLERYNGDDFDDVSISKVIETFFTKDLYIDVS